MRSQSRPRIFSKELFFVRTIGRCGYRTLPKSPGRSKGSGPHRSKGCAAYNLSRSSINGGPSRTLVASHRTVAIGVCTPLRMDCPILARARHTTRIAVPPCLAERLATVPGLLESSSISTLFRHNSHNHNNNNNKNSRHSRGTVVTSNNWRRPGTSLVGALLETTRSLPRTDVCHLVRTWDAGDPTHHLRHHACLHH